MSFARGSTVKPANILLAHHEAGKQRILLTDFGIAKRIDDASRLTATNVTMGTVAYGAPEQLMGSPIDGQADQYALAATAFHLLTGIPPFHPRNPAIAISQHLAPSPPKLATYRPELAYLDRILFTALARKPGSRFEHCVDFASSFGCQINAHSAKPDVIRPKVSTSAPSKKPKGKPTPHSKPSTSRTGRTRSRISTALMLATVIPTVFMIAAATLVAQLFAREHEPPIAVSPPSSAASSPAPKSAPRPAPPPKAVVGARCPVVGVPGVTVDGATAYCSRLQFTDRQLWSLHPGDIPNPVLSAQPAAPPPADDEAPVRICMRQTGQNWNGCAGDIHRADGP